MQPISPVLSTQLPLSLSNGKEPLKSQDSTKTGEYLGKSLVKLKSENKIWVNFVHFTFPFLQLLKAIRTPCRYGVYKIKKCFNRVSAAVIEVFARIIFLPKFDPNSPAFKNSLDEVEKSIPSLVKRIKSLSEKFKDKHWFASDLKELKELVGGLDSVDDQLHSCFNDIKDRKKPVPIQPQLCEVMNAYEKMNNYVKEYFLDNEVKIVKKFKEIIDYFAKGMSQLPDEVRLELQHTFKDLFEIYTSVHGSKSEGQVFDLLVSIHKTLGEMDFVSGLGDENNSMMGGVKEPLSLKNIGNSCYFDSVLESLLCIDSVRELLKKDLMEELKKEVSAYVKTDLAKENPKKAQAIIKEKKDATLKAIAIQKEIVQFIHVQEKNFPKPKKKMSQMEYILYLKDGGEEPSLHRLREAFFDSKFNQDFSSYKLIDQHDAAQFLLLLIDNLATECKFHWQGHATTPVFPGVEFLWGGKGNAEVVSILEVSLKNPNKAAPLGKLIAESLKTEVNKKMDPKDGVVVDEKLAKEVMKADPVVVQDVQVNYRFKKLPPVLNIRLKRFSHEGKGKHGEKNDKPVILPKNGILDLTPYYDAPEGESKKALYRIRSMVIHGGSLNGGHYVANVNIKGKYFFCDDTSSKGFKEISKEKFYGHTDPYILCLERIKDDEDVEVSAEQEVEEVLDVQKALGAEKDSEEGQEVFV